MTTFKKLPTSRPDKKYPAIRSAGYSRKIAWMLEMFR